MTLRQGRYQFVQFLDSAVFSSALFCVDLADDRDVCLKVIALFAPVSFDVGTNFFDSTLFESPPQVIKNSKDFFDQSLDEIKLLKLLQQHDPDDRKNVLRLYDFFYFKVVLRTVTCSARSFSRSVTG